MGTALRSPKKETENRPLSPFNKLFLIDFEGRVLYT